MDDEKDWIQMTDAATLRTFIESIHSPDVAHEVSGEETIISTRPLSFYKDIVLVRVANTEPDRTPVSYYLHKKGVLFRLNGSSIPIHEVNATEPIRIDEGNVLDYLRFFCRFVHGPDGAFWLLRNASELSDLKNIDKETLAKLEEVFSPPAIVEQRGESFLCQGLIFYGDDLFKARFTVTPFGNVDMMSDEPIDGFAASEWLPSIKKYPFPWPNDERGYRLFPDELENDPLVAFHGTVRANLESIIDKGFAFAGSLQSLSFAKDSALPLSYACKARSSESPEGCVIAVRFRPPIPRPGVGVETSVIHVYKLDEQPKVIGYCVVPADYKFV